jgi:hypothetical protein
LLSSSGDFEIGSIINVSWTRGTKIPRQDHGVTRWFNPFCPKVIAGVSVDLPGGTTATRAITVKTWPKLPHEKVEEFSYTDNDDLLMLRRKLARWCADNAQTLAQANPVRPDGFNNRVAMNWKLLFAIADLAGDEWPKLARKAAVKLTKERDNPSEGKRLLAAFRNLFSKQSMLTSADVQKALAADPNSEWADFRGHGPISQRQIAVLLDPFDIHPDVIHPQGRKAERGYKAEWFEKAFTHFLADKRTTVREPRGKPRK